MSQASSPWSFTGREGYLFGWMRQKRNGVVALSVAEFWLGGGCLMFTRHRWTIPNSSNDRDRCSAEFVLFDILSRYLCRRHNGARVPRFLRSHNIQHHEARAAADDASDCAIRRKTRFNFVFRNSQNQDFLPSAIGKERLSMLPYPSQSTNTRDQSVGYQPHSYISRQDTR